MTFRLDIAATRQDWIDLFSRGSADELLRFYLVFAADLESLNPMRIIDIPNLGIAKTGRLVQEVPFIALPATEQPAPREIRQNDGIIRYVMDHGTNLDSFILRPGGTWQNDVYIVGEISSLAKSGLA